LQESYRVAFTTAKEINSSLYSKQQYTLSETIVFILSAMADQRMR